MTQQEACMAEIRVRAATRADWAWLTEIYNY